MRILLRNRFILSVKAGGQGIHPRIRQVVQPQSHHSHRDPDGCEHGADLSQEIPRLVPVVPDVVVPVHQQPGSQLHRGDDPRPGPHPGSLGHPDLFQLADEQKAHAPGTKHADMAAAPVKQLQSNISPASNAEKSQFSCDFHDTFTSEKVFPKIPRKKL